MALDKVINVIPQIITQIANKNVIKLGATNPTRDFNFVEDTCRSYIAVANSSKTIGEVVNSASNFMKYLLAKLALLISKIMNSEIDIVQANERYR